MNPSAPIPSPITRAKSPANASFRDSQRRQVPVAKIAQSFRLHSSRQKRSRGEDTFNKICTEIQELLTSQVAQKSRVTQKEQVSTYNTLKHIDHVITEKLK